MPIVQLEPLQGGYADLLVMELTHRFHNSLQVINSLLWSLTRTSETPEEIIARTEAVRERVIALSSLHQRLSRRRDEDDDLEQYCRSICEALAHGFGRGDISLVLSFEPVSLSRRKETRLLYLVAELVTNAIKHNRADGVSTVWIDLRKAGADALDLLVRDNGDAIVSPAATPRVAGALARSLGGELRVRVDAGFAAHACFPAADRADSFASEAADAAEDGLVLAAVSADIPPG